MRINVHTPEDAKLLWKPDGVFLQDIFYHHYFWILVEKDGSELKFEVNLPEWLVELTSFLKATEATTSYNKNMTLSGDNFIAEKKNNIRKIKVFDQNKTQLEWLNLTENEAGLLHARLVCELIEAVEQATGKPMQIKDLDRLEIGGVA